MERQNLALHLNHKKIKKVNLDQNDIVLEESNFAEIFWNFFRNIVKNL